MTITASIIDKNTIKLTDFSPVNIRKEMVQNPEESLWIHANEPEDIFQLQGAFGLHPLSVEVITHENQPILYDLGYITLGPYNCKMGFSSCQFKD